MIIPDALVVGGFVGAEVDAVDAFDDVAVAAVVTIGVGLVAVDTIAGAVDVIAGAVDVISWSVVARAVVAT